MSEPYIGQIMSVGFPFAPVGWAQCNAQLLSIAQQTALFALLGTTYGGDGVTTFAVPNLSGRVIIGSGPAPAVGLDLEPGAVGGAVSVTLISSQVPGHTHPATGTVSLGALSAQGNVSLPVDARVDNQPVTVKGAMSASTAAATGELPTAGCTIGDPPGGTKLYASYDASTAVPLAEITSTGQLSAPLTGTASGSATLSVTGTASTSITVSPNGTAGLPIGILPPYLAMLNIIALEGIFPNRP